jgi:hypothetical protein
MDFLEGMYNIFEQVNLSNKPLLVATKLYNILGIEQSVHRTQILPGAQADILVHDMQGREFNSYGRVCVGHDGSPGDMDARMVYYKQGLGHGVGDIDFQFAFAMPVTNGIKGSQFVTYNTFQPSFNFLDKDNLVANWIQLTNVSKQVSSGILSFFDMHGNIVGVKRVTLNAGC